MWDQRIIVNGKLIQNMTDEEIKRHYNSPKARESFRMMVDVLDNLERRYISMMFFQKYGEELDVREYSFDIQEAAWRLIRGVYNCILTQRDLDNFELIKKTASRESYLEALREFGESLERHCAEINKTEQGKCGPEWIILG